MTGIDAIKTKRDGIVDLFFLLRLLQLNDEQRYWCVARTLLNWKIEGALTNCCTMAFADAEQPGSEIGFVSGNAAPLRR